MTNWVSAHPDMAIALAYVGIGLLGGILRTNRSATVRAVGARLEAVALALRKVLRGPYD